MLSEDSDSELLSLDPDDPEPPDPAEQLLELTELSDLSEGFGAAPKKMFQN